MPQHTFKDAEAKKDVRSNVNGLGFNVLEIQAERFSDAQASDWTLQQLVRWLYQKKLVRLG